MGKFSLCIYVWYCIEFEELKNEHIAMTRKLVSTTLNNEPMREKTSSLGFRPGPTQTGLYKHRRQLES